MKTNYNIELGGLDIDVDFTRWVLGIEWYREMKWVEISIFCVQICFNWRSREVFRNMTDERVEIEYNRIMEERS